MGAKWRLLVLFGYAGLLVWEMATIASPYGGIEVLSFESAIMLVALAPIAFLCLVPLQHDAMGILALLVIGFGIWLYDLNDGDPIGLLIVIFYQYCATGLGFAAIIIGTRFLKARL
jgi:hypothetical protein